jgi:hypothetical protein
MIGSSAVIEGLGGTVEPLTVHATPLSSGTAFVRFAETSVVGASIV